MPRGRLVPNQSTTFALYPNQRLLLGLSLIGGGEVRLKKVRYQHQGTWEGYDTLAFHEQEERARGGSAGCTEDDGAVSTRAGRQLSYL